jgi:hypothetical protein
MKSLVPFELNKTQRNVEIFGASPPGFFVGHFSYPNVYLGPLIPFQEFETGLEISDYHILDAPELWFGKKIVDIIRYRSSLVRSNFKTNVFVGRKSPKNTPSLKIQRLLETSQELSMAARPVDTETKLEKMNLRIMMDNHALPMGPSGMTDKITITENTKVHPQVDYCVSDTDLTATEADDIISKALIKEIKKFPEIDDYQIFEATYLDNHFKILLFPGKFLYEMNEVWAPNTLWNISLDGSNQNLKPQIMTDFEFYKGRKNYASNITGAYYAARKSVCEYLYNIKKQARVLIFREVSGGYVVPLGVWVIRETVNNAMFTTDPVKLDNFNDAINKMAENFMVEFKYWKNSSKLINFIKTQKTLDNFL